MAIAALPPVMGRRTLGTAVLALTVTQIIGWGTTFHLPAVLSARMAEGIGLPVEMVFGGLTIMLLVAAVVSPAVGRVMEREGARRPMVLGSCLMSVGLLLLGTAHGPVLFVLAWLVIGLAFPFALTQAASTALVQIAPEKARRAVAILLLLSGFSSSIAWPILIELDTLIGWRDSVFLYAAVNLVVCGALHALCLPRGRVNAGTVRPRQGSEATALPDAPPVRGAFTLTAIALSLSGMLTWGLPLHMIGMLRDYGHSEAAAVTIGALFGPGQVLARGFEMMGGHKLDILKVGVGASALLPAALLVLLLLGTWETGAIAFSLLYGLSAGLMSVVRAVAPLRLFGAAAYATMLGRLGVPMNVAFAAAPLGFAVIHQTFGSPVLALLSLVLAAISCATLLILSRRAA